MSLFDRFFGNGVPNGMDFEEQRRWMVEHQLREWGISDPRVLDAMGRVPRELFVPPEYRESAYYDGALPIGEGQTISQPYVVAHMTMMLELKGHEKVLEVGTGSGYQAAVLSLLAREVHTIERIPRLAERARQVLVDELKLTNVHFHIGDGSKGWPEAAPYDAILVTCASPTIPPPLIEQLAPGGRMVIPVGPRGLQELVLVRKEDSKVSQEKRAPVAFVPMIGEYGW
ncbi:MAG: protein-L-isoaspartate(D-aspartate) O-methyltransferase [Caldilineales bacterium]|nr:protein-L-isoaspartate(D-aspartate) O-methyltransferase [Caldilineales bacterium]MDW8317714.1 protein-L-isoaspartate(D-aspartate) O-methyltransferase [Anaerolineae bacterium]